MKTIYKYLFLLIFIFLFACKQSSYNHNLQTTYTPVEKKHLSYQKNLPATNHLINHSRSILLLNNQENLVGIFSTPHRAKNITQVLL